MKMRRTLLTLIEMMHENFKAVIVLDDQAKSNIVLQ